jgi:pentatricopeptide repeat-containing protein PET309
MAKDKFLQASHARGESFDLNTAWDTYNAAQECHALNSLPVEELLSFAEKIASSAESFYRRRSSLDVVHSWGGRLQRLLDDIHLRLSGLSSFDHRRRCLLVRALALIGDLQQATSTASELRMTHAEPVESDAVVQAYEGIVMSTMIHFDSTHVLDFLVLEWMTIGCHTSLRSAAGAPYVPALLSFRRRVHSILASIVNPAEVLRNRREWDTVQRQRMGELLIQVLCHKTMPEDALAVFQEMTQQNLHVSASLQLDLIRSLAKTDAFGPANALFSSLSQAPYMSRHYLTTGLYLFAQQGNISQAEAYYGHLEAHNVVTAADMAMLLHVYALQGNAEKVIALFYQFFPDNVSKRDIRPNVRHYTIVIFAHAQRGDFDGMNTWLKSMTEAGYLPDVFVYNIILKSFAMRGEVDSVAAVLDQMRAAGIKPEPVSYTTVVTLLAERRDSIAAEAIYKRAISEGVVPDRRMITSLMNAHAEAGSWQGVIRAFDYLATTPTRRLRLTLEVYNTLLKAYVLIGAPFHVVSKVFSRLERANVNPDAYTFALLIQSACDAGLMNVASEMFLEMDKLSDHWRSNLHINAYVLTIIMAGFLRLDDKGRAVAVFEDMQKRGIQPTSVTFGHIIKSYCNEKTEESLKLAEKFLQSLIKVKPDKRTWITPPGGRMSSLEHVYGPLMHVYANKAEPEEVLRLFEEYLNEGGKPTLGILTALLHAYRGARHIDAMVQLWPQIFQLALRYSRVDSLLEDSNLAETNVYRQTNLLCVPLSIYIDGLSTAGRHLEVAEIWRQLQVNGFAFDSHNWNHLAVALVRAGEPQRAFQILESVILPYQRQSERVLRTRDQAPDSPLTLDIFPPQEDSPAMEAPLRSAKNRAYASQRASNNLGPYLEDVDTQDFAHPLHILYQISPAWDIWRPHAVTLRLLVMVLSHLELGMIVRPLGAGQDLEPLNIDREERLAMRRLASDMLERIYKDYPRAVRVVQEFEREMQRRDGELYNPYMRKSYSSNTE